MQGWHEGFRRKKKKNHLMKAGRSMGLWLSTRIVRKLYGRGQGVLNENQLPLKKYKATQMNHFSLGSSKCFHLRSFTGVLSDGVFSSLIFFISTLITSMMRFPSLLVMRSSFTTSKTSPSCTCTEKQLLWCIVSFA